MARIDEKNQWIYREQDSCRRVDHHSDLPRRVAAPKGGQIIVQLRAARRKAATGMVTRWTRPFFVAGVDCLLPHWTRRSHADWTSGLGAN
jgi:hypothetical protein